MSWYNKNGNDNDIVLSTRVRLARNIKGVPFPKLLGEEGAQKIISDVRSAALMGREEFSVISMREIDNVEKQALLERHLISAELMDNSLPRAVIINKDETISVMINEEDHLRIQCLMPGLAFQEAWDAASNMDILVGERIEYGFHERYGYLTCCPTNAGTGLRASVMMHLPSLAATGNLSQLLNSVGKLGMTVRGIYGEGTEAHGHLFQISNQVTLGQSEEEIIQKLDSMIRQIITKEREARAYLQNNGGARLRDRIMRAYGLAGNAYVITTEECMKFLSDVRLGVNMGILSNISLLGLSGLLVDIQPAHIIKAAGKQLSAVERDIFRARMLRMKMGKE